MSKNSSYGAERVTVKNMAETASEARGSGDGSAGRQCVRISDQKKWQILRLIEEGENLDPLDLQVFYGWLHESYEALRFHPLQRSRFDKYCRSSCDSNITRVYLGVWMLKFALGSESDGKDSE